MEYKRNKNIIIARLDKGEEVLECIKELALKENIKLANINYSFMVIGSKSMVVV